VVEERQPWALYHQRMRRAAEIAAQVFTARDALLRDTPEDLRVAFLLFDSAAETLMVRRIDSLFLFHLRDWGGHPSPPWRESVAVDLNDSGQKARLEAAASTGFVHWQLSATQRRDVDRDFESKLRLLAWDAAIPPEYVPVIGRLHAYRNEMYHRDESRPNALRIGVHLYAWLVADLLDRLKPNWMGYSSADPDDLEQRTYARMGTSEVSTTLERFDEGFSIQSRMADALRSGIDLSTAPELLADYACERTNDLHDSIRYAGTFIRDTQGLEKVSEMDVVRLIYSTDPMKGIEELRGFKAPITRAMIQRWDDWPEQIRLAGDPVEAFRSLATFEASFEEFEAKVRELARAVEEEIQLRMDIARGK